METQFTIMLGLIFLMLIVVIMWNILQDLKLRKVKEYILRNNFSTQSVDEKVSVADMEREKVILECQNCKTLKQRLELEIEEHKKVKEKLDKLKEAIGIPTEKQKEKEKVTGAEKNVRRKDKVLW